MKRFLFIAVVLLCLVSVLSAAITNTLSGRRPTAYWWTSATSPADRAMQWAIEVETLLGPVAGTATANKALILGATTNVNTLLFSSGQIVLTAVAEPTGTTEGTLYMDTDHSLYYHNGTTWVACGSGTFTGGSITSDVTLSNAVDIMSSTTTAEAASIKVYDTTGPSYTNVLSWTNGAVPDIVAGSGTSTFALASTGLNVTTGGAMTGISTIAASGAISGTTGTFSSGIVLDSAGTITNTTDSEFKFTDGGEDISLDMDSASDVVGLKSGSGVVGLAFGTVDDLSGIGTIAFDAAAASITTPTTGDAQDLTVGITGTTNSSLILASSGTGADALQVSTSAGGMDIAVAGAAAGEDLDLAANTSITIKASEASADDSIVIQALGAASGIDIISLGDIDITTTGAATEDITISNAGGSLILRANENDAAAIVIDTTGGGGTSEAITITNDQGTGAASIAIQSTAGGIDIDAAAALDVDIAGGQVLLSSKDNAGSAIALTANVGASETIVVTNTKGTGEGAITLTSTVGGIDLNAAAGKNVDILGGQFIVLSNEDVANAIYLRTNTGTAETINITNTAGTATNAINLTSTAGGIDIDCAAAKIIDIDGGTIQIDSATAGAGAIALTANQGATDTVTITNTQGTGAGALTLTATAGGITLTSNAGLATGDPITGDGTAALGGFLKTVTNDVNGTILTIAESGTIQTNAGAGAAAAWTLPDAAAGLEYTFVVMAAQQLRVTPAAGDVIYINAIGASAAEYWWADAVGENLHVIAVDATNWIAISYTGTWTQQTP